MFSKKRFLGSFVVPLVLSFLVTSCGSESLPVSPDSDTISAGSATSAPGSIEPTPSTPDPTDFSAAKPAPVEIVEVIPVDEIISNIDDNLAENEVIADSNSRETETIPDSDGDGINDDEDPDDDNDGFNDEFDAFPLDSSEFLDLDSDGIGDFADQDDDNDGVFDQDDFLPLDPECSSELEMHEGECVYSYSDAADRFEFDNNGFVYLINSEHQLVFKYNLENQKWHGARKLDSHSEGDTNITSIGYSRGHGRLYVSYNTGVLTYIDPDTLESTFFHESPAIISSIAEAGRFLLFRQGGDDYILMDATAKEINRFDDFELFYAQRRAGILWLPTVNKLAFLDNSSGIRTYHIDQASGDVGEKNHVQYSQSHKITGPLVVSDNDEHFIVGTGSTFTVSELNPLSPLGHELVDAQWSERHGITVLQDEGGQTRLIRYDNERKVAENIVVDGKPLNLIRHGENYYVASTDEQGYRFTLFVPSDDTDKDLVVNELDAFPNDPAASVDTDKDGAPDYWNDGYTGADSNSELVLDAYPDDWACYHEADGNGTHCNYANMLPISRPSYITAASNDVVYLVFKSEGMLARWDSKSQMFLKPFRVQRSTDNESYTPSAVTYSPTTDRLYLGYPDGAVSYLYLPDGSDKQTDLVSLPGAVITLAEAGDFLKIQNELENSTWIDSQYYDHAGTAVGESTQQIEAIAYSLWDEQNSRFYYFDMWSFEFNYEQLDEYGAVVDTVSTGQIYEGVFIEQPVGPILLTPDSSNVILGNNLSFDAGTLEKTGSFSSFTTYAWSSDRMLLAGTSTYNGGKVTYRDELYNQLGEEQLSGRPLALFEIDQQFYAVTHEHGLPVSIVTLTRPGSEPNESTISSLDNSSTDNSGSADGIDLTDGVASPDDNNPVDPIDYETQPAGSTEPEESPEEVAYNLELLLTEFPAQMTYGVEYQFGLHFFASEDLEGNPLNTLEISTALIAGPEGMSYENGMVTWRPTPVMFSPIEEFHATFEASDGTAETITISVVHENQKSPIAKSRIGYHHFSQTMRVLDWDGDGTEELLTIDNYNRLSTVEVNDGKVSQKWLYPFSTSDGEDIQYVERLDYDDRKFIIATRENVELIESPDSPPVVVYTPEGQIYSVTYSDLNNDGVSELVIQLSGGRIEILDAQTFTVTQTLLDDDSHGGIATGNLDDDPALEIVTGGGEVFDGVTGEQQWSQPGYIGGNIAIGDINNDGLNEIVASGYWIPLSSYDLRTKTKTPLGIQNICDIEIINADSDPQNELIVSGCQSDGVSIYDASTGTAELQYNFDYSDDRDAGALLTGDIDNDGFPELIWKGDPYEPGATDTPNYSPLVVTSIPGTQDETPANPIITASTPPDEHYYVANRLNGIGEPRSAAFVIPGVKYGVGQKLATLNDQGELVVGNPLSEESYEAGYQSFVMGLGNDLSIAMPGSQTAAYVDDFHVRHLTDETLMVEHTELGEVEQFYSRRISTLRSGVLDDGSTLALIGTNKGKIQVFDITNEQILWDGPIIDEEIKNMGLIQVNGVYKVFVQSESSLSWYRPIEGILQIAATKELKCQFTEILENNAEVLIACAVNPNANHYESEKSIQIFNSQLSPVSHFSIPFTISEMTRKHSATGDKLLIGGYSGSGHVYIVDPMVGTIIWESPSLLGEITGIDYQSEDDSGENYMSISTTRAIYLTQ